MGCRGGPAIYAPNPNNDAAIANVSTSSDDIIGVLLLEDVMIILEDVAGSVSNDGIRGKLFCPTNDDDGWLRRLFLLIDSRNFCVDSRTRSVTGDSFDIDALPVVLVPHRMDAVFDILSSSSVDILQLSSLSVALTSSPGIAVLSSLVMAVVNMALLSNMTSSKPIFASEDNK
jgi:hypothetical protein